MINVFMRPEDQTVWLEAKHWGRNDYYYRQLGWAKDFPDWLNTELREHKQTDIC